MLSGFFLQSKSEACEQPKASLEHHVATSKGHCLERMVHEKWKAFCGSEETSPEQFVSPCFGEIKI